MNVSGHGGEIYCAEGLISTFSLGGHCYRFRIPLSPVKVCGGVREIRLDLSDEKGLSDYLLGADARRSVLVHGLDEVGRKVMAEVRF